VINQQNNPSRSYDFLWLSLALLVVLSFAFLLPLTPHDYWFYLPIGRETLQTGSVPAQETFSYTYAGQPIHYQPWLAAVIFWLTYDAGGLPATFFLRAVLIALSYGLIWMQIRRMDAGPRFATLLVIVLGLVTNYNWSVRPQLFAYPLFVLAFMVLWDWDRGQNKKLWLLPVIGLLWVNLHGSFVLLFALAGMALVFGKGDRKALALWTAAALLLTLINPRGPGAWGYVVELLNSPSDQLFSAEWQPPVNKGWQMNIFFAWLLLFIPLAALSPRRLSNFEWVAFVAFGWLAFSGVRYVIWFAFLLAVFSASLLAEWDRRTLDPPVNTTAPKLNILIGALLLLLPLLLLPGLREAWWKESPPAVDLAATPVAATQWLVEHPEVPGPMWSDYVFGGYLVYALPARPTWIDSRFNAFPPEHWEKYITISRAASNWNALLDEDNVNLLMLSPARQPALLNAVEASIEWCEAYRDEDAVIFTRLTSEVCP
jgi:hypothetical protein